GVMSRIGLGYHTLIQHNPKLVMLSTCNMGQTGPRAMTPGFGSQLSALSGFCGLTGASDGPPMLLYGPYIDFIAANFGASAVLAALDKARRHGEASHIDLSQYETGLQFMAGALFDYHMNGNIADRKMNADPVAVPHGVYPCLNNEWVTLSCWSNEEFQRLAAIMNRIDLASDARFATEAQRHENEPVLNEIIAGWTADQAAISVTTLVQDQGICAYPVNSVADVFSDPQLRELGTWRWRRHAEIGMLACNFPPFDLCETPGDIYNTAPLFGEGNDYVYRELIGLSDAEMEKYLQDGVIGI
ncbi:MAG: CoA transferase, partial [Gammaproteobacteria bacterium]|nr:CoA transferase [Gammaproteobacteria bacterium]